ncbi:MAG: DUF6279 family lipoprotein, partial [Alphaproteobacteria bacterium]|nr:DUF6279 family lipoprotein [Alphaproteobacteria bacterium]
MRLVVFCLSVLVLTSCSSLQFAYFFADDIVQYRADDYLKLEDHDRKHLSKMSKQLVAWHRSEMLPSYADFIEENIGILGASDIQPEEFSKIFKSFRSLVDDTVKGAAPFISKVLVEHQTTEKLSYLQEKMDKSLEKREQKAANKSSEQIIQDRIDSRLKSISRFIKDLNENQIEIVRHHSQNSDKTYM